MKPNLCLVLVLILLSRVSSLASLTFLDITPGTFDPGTFDTAPSFTGTLAGVGVIGTFAGGANTTLEIVAPGVGFSTIINDSPQWSHAPVYTPTSALDDRVGLSQTPGGAGFVTLTFASPMSNLIFHVANLDLAALSFTGGPGLTGLVMLSGNGPPIGAPGDGLGVGGPTIFDITPGTTDGTPPGVPPPLAGSRAAYGSVMLTGTYSTLAFTITPTAGIDNFNFTLSVPEPGISALAAMGGLGILLRRRRNLA